jgi:enolase
VVRRRLVGPDGRYTLAREGAVLDSAGMEGFWRGWADRFPLVSLEDGLAEDDWEGWASLTASLGGRLQLVADDLLVTNPERIRRALSEKSANSLLAKVNQVGTLTEATEADNRHVTPLTHLPATQWRPGSNPGAQQRRGPFQIQSIGNFQDK